MRNKSKKNNKNKNKKRNKNDYIIKFLIYL